MFDTHYSSIRLLLQGRRSWGAVILSAIMVWSLGIAGSSNARAAQATATLTAGTASGMAGANVDLAINFAPASSTVSTLQFDLRYPVSLGYVTSVTGAAATAAQKSAYVSATSSGANVVVFGLNNNAIGSGALLVVTLAIAPGTAVSTIPIMVENVVASDPAAVAVQVLVVNGSVNVVAPPDATPPVISNIALSNLSSSGVTVAWTTNEASDSQVEYGTSTSYGSATVLNAGLVTAHTQAVSGLAPSTLYHYRVISKDASGNTAVSADGVFTTLALSSDTTPPAISSIAVSGMTSTSVSIKWTTNEASNSQVQYGTTTAYGNSTALDPAMVTAHSLTLSSLTPDTTYHYLVKSADAAGNLATSTDLTFTTPANNGAPTIYNIMVTQITPQGATIAWNTDVPSDTVLFYGTTTDCGVSTKPNTRLDTVHSQNVNRLRASTVYYYRAQSKSAAGLVTKSDVFSFKTASNKRTKATSSQSIGTEAAGSDSAGKGDEENAIYAGVVVTNFGATPAELTFTAHRRDAEDVTAADKAQRTLLPGKQLVLMDFELFGDRIREPGKLDWIDVSSSSRDVTGFTMTFDAGLSMLDHSMLLPARLSGFLFTVIGNSDSTSIHINNPNARPAHLTFQLVQSDGQIRASVQRGLEPGVAMTESVSTLFPDTITAGTDYMRVTSDAGVTAFERFRMNSEDTAGFSGLDMNGGKAALFCPHYAAGGDYQTTLSVTNLEGRNGTLELRLYGDDGAQIGATRYVPVSGYGKVDISDPSFFAATGSAPMQGYVQISGGGLRITGHVVFGDSVSGTALAALPLADQPQKAMVISHIASNSVSFTELALINPNDSDALALVKLYQADGKLDASMEVTIPAGQRIMRSLTELFPQLAGQDRSSGYLEVLADQAVIGFSLLGTRDLRAIDAVQAQPVPGGLKPERREGTPVRYPREPVR